MDSLYHYFDRQQWQGESALKIASDLEENDTERCHRFRYAALNLAALHCRFGHRYAFDEVLPCLRLAKNENNSFGLPGLSLGAVTYSTC